MVVDTLMDSVVHAVFAYFDRVCTCHAWPEPTPGISVAWLQSYTRPCVCCNRRAHAATASEERMLYTHVYLRSHAMSGACGGHCKLLPCERTLAYLTAIGASLSYVAMHRDKTLAYRNVNI